MNPVSPTGPSHRGRHPVTAAQPPGRKPAGRAGEGWLDRMGERYARPILAAMMLLEAGVLSWFVLLKFRFYLYSDIDCALFVQAVDGILRGSFYSSIRGMNWLGDHSSLVLFLVAPVYAVFRHPATLPILQSVVLALGAIPVFGLARREIGRGAIPLGFAALYLLYPAVGYTALYEFHPEVLCTTTLLAMIASHRADRLGWTMAFAALSLMGKEDVALPVAAYALLSLLDRGPRRRVHALALLSLAAASLLVSFAVLKPAFGMGEVDYGRLYLDWGTRPGEVALNILRHPLRAATAFFMTPGYPLDTALKLQFHLHLLLPLLFLPVLSPITAVAIGPTLATHFLSWRSPQHTIYYQYTALITPFLITASVLGLRNLLRRRAGAGGLSLPEALGGRRDVRAFARWILLGMLGATLACHLMYGPLLGHGILQLVRAEEPVSPTGEDRALARHRDRMMSVLGSRDSVVAGWEFLTRLAARRNTRSFHNVLEGRHTFSTRAYPSLTDASALLVDVSQPRLSLFVVPGSAGRARALIAENRLGLVGAAGDVLLYLRDAPDSVEIWREGGGAPADPQRVVFDGEIAYLGDEFLATTVEPGGLLPLRTFWSRVAPSASTYVLELTAYDSLGRAVFSHWRHLGYMQHPIGTWPDSTPVRETYRLVVPQDVTPGTYMLGMRVGRRSEERQVLSETDDARVRAQNNVVELGRFTVLPLRGR